MFSAWNCQFKDDDLEYCLYQVVLFKVLGLECSGFRVLWMNKTAENLAWSLDIVKREFDSESEWKICAVILFIHLRSAFKIYDSILRPFFLAMGVGLTAVNAFNSFQIE